MSASPAFRRTDRSLPIALLRARETVMAPLREMLSQSGISEQKWRVLRVLDEGGPLDQKAIARQACLLLPSLTRMLQAMEAEGLVARATDADDRRRTVVTITEPGRAMIASHASQSDAILNRLEQRLGPERLALLLDLLDELQRSEPGAE